MRHCEATTGLREYPRRTALPDMRRIAPHETLHEQRKLVSRRSQPGPPSLHKGIVMNKNPTSGAPRRTQGKVQEAPETGAGTRHPPKGAARQNDNERLQSALANVKAALKNSRHS
jgi:hypothetical protein